MQARRVLVGLLAVLLGVELAWLVGMNAVLGAHLIPKHLQHEHAPLALDYGRAYSLWPGDLRVRQFWIRGRDRKHVEWMFTIESAHAQVALLPLIWKEFRTRSLSAGAVTARFRSLVSPEELPKEARLLGLGPPIPGFGNVPRMPYGPEGDPHHPTRAKWQVDLEHVHVGDVQELWVDAFHFAGDGVFDGRFQLRPLRSVEFGPSTLTVGHGQVTVGDAIALGAVHGRVEATLERYDPLAVRHREILRRLTGAAQLEGTLGDLAFLRPFVPSAAISSRAGRISVDASVRRGLLADGSTLHAFTPGLRVATRRGDARGEGRITMRAQEHHARVALVLSPVHGELHLSRTKLALEGDRVELSANLSRPDLVAPLAGGTALVQLESVRANDLTPLAALLPRDVKLRSGRARVDGELELGIASHAGRGELHVSTDPIALDVRGQPLRFLARADVHLHALELRPLRFDASGSSFETTLLEAPGLRGGDDWWLRGELTQAEAMLGRSHRFVAFTFDGSARDGKPVLAELHRLGKLPAVVASLFSLSGLKLHTDAILDGRTLTLSPLRVAGGHTELVGAMRRQGQESDGAFLVRVGPANLGFSLGAGKLHLHSLSAERWFAMERRKFGPTPEAEARRGSRGIRPRGPRPRR